MAKQNKISFVNIYKKLAKQKREAQAQKQQVVTAECGGKKEVYVMPVEHKDTPERKEKGFKRDLKKLHSVWDYIKTNNLILKAFSCHILKDGKKITKPVHTRYLKFLHKENKFWLINANFIFDPSRVLPKNEIVGAHIYRDGNMQFTTKTCVYITCEPYYGKKVKKDGEDK